MKYSYFPDEPVLPFSICIKIYQNPSHSIAAARVLKTLIR